MNLQRIIIASESELRMIDACEVGADTLYFDDLHEFLLVSGRINLSESLVCWFCKDNNDFNMLQSIRINLDHWIIIANPDSDICDDLFKKGIGSLLPLGTSLPIIEFHVKKMEKLIWNSLNAFNPYEGTCYLFGTKIEGLTKKEIQLLKLFVAKEGHRVEKDEVIKHIWRDVLVNSKTLDVHFYNLRRKLAPYGISIKLIRRGEWELRL